MHPSDTGQFADGVGSTTAKSQLHATKWSRKAVPLSPKRLRLHHTCCRVTLTHRFYVWTIVLKMLPTFWIVCQNTAPLANGDDCRELAGAVCGTNVIEFRLNGGAVEMKVTALDATIGCGPGCTS
jgi:hypothetical protein